MNIKKIFFLSAVFVPAMVCASITLPSLVSPGSIGWMFLIISMLLEFYFLYYFIHQSLLRVVSAVVLINIVSHLPSMQKLIAVIINKAIAIGGTLFTCVPLQLSQQKVCLFEFMTSYALLFLITVLIETIVALPIFGTKHIKKLILIIALANAVSIIFGNVGSYVYQYAQQNPARAAAQIDEVEE